MGDGETERVRTIGRGLNPSAAYCCCCPDEEAPAARSHGGAMRKLGGRRLEDGATAIEPAGESFGEPGALPVPPFGVKMERREPALLPPPPPLSGPNPP